MRKSMARRKVCDNSIPSTLTNYSDRKEAPPDFFIDPGTRMTSNHKARGCDGMPSSSTVSAKNSDQNKMYKIGKDVDRNRAGSNRSSTYDITGIKPGGNGLTSRVGDNALAGGLSMSDEDWTEASGRDVTSCTNVI